MPKNTLELLVAKLSGNGPEGRDVVVVLDPTGTKPEDVVSSSNFAGLTKLRVGLYLIKSLAVERGTTRAHIHKTIFEAGPNTHVLTKAKSWSSVLDD